MGVKRPLLSTVKGGAVLFPLLAVLLSACSGPSTSLRRKIDAQIAQGNYPGAQNLIENEKQGSYGQKNRVLYHLDLGGVLYDAGKYKDSDQNFATAEDDMDALYTKSIHQAAGTLLLNDNTVDYAGERFERAFVNVYRALNYLFLGDRDDALVEIRKLSRLLQEYADTAKGATSYKDDAFAQYLSSLLYEDGGQPDDARIALEASDQAYQNYATAYFVKKPAIDPAPLDGPNGELVFIHANGVAPHKESKYFQVAWGEGLAAINSSSDANAGQARNAIRAGVLGNAFTVSFPVYVQDPFRIHSSAVEVDGRVAETQMVENVSAIAQKALAERQALIRTRAVARAAIKYVLSQVAVNEAKKRYGANSWQALAARAGTAVVSAATETADIRSWATLPAQFLMARMPLPPGEHQVTVRYRSPQGEVLLTRNFTVTIRKGQRAYLHDRTAL
ncbi:MAG: COG3014 family protein [Elusimicrobiota bacterium]